MADNFKETISKLAIEYWRVIRSYERNLSNITNNSSAASTIRNSEKKFQSILQECNIRIYNFEGQDYTPNLPLTVINNDEFETNKDLIIHQMIQPTIVDENGVISMGKAVLTRKVY